MELKLIDNSSSTPVEYNFKEESYRITYIYEHAFSRFAIRIESKFDDTVFLSELESIVDKIKNIPSLEARLMLNNEINRIVNVTFDKYNLTHNQSIFGTQIIIEDIYLKCL